MDLFELFTQHYFVTTIAAVAFLIFVRYGSVDSRRTTYNFTMATVSILVLIAAEIGESYYASMSEPTFMRVLISAVAYTARPAIAFFMVRITAYRRTPRLAKYLAIPLIVDIIVSFSALVSPLAFSYTASNSFTRGPLGFTPFIVSGIYLALLVYYAFKGARRKEMQGAVICGCVVLLCVLIVYMEYALSYVGALPALALWGEVFYLVHLISGQYSRDQLTGAYVRRHLYRDVDSRSGTRYYITFDVNGLKQINDSRGHTAGDEELVKFAHGVFGCLPFNATFYRLGGDEFAIVYHTTNKDDVISLLDKIGKACKDMPYGVSWGYACFINSRDFNDAAAAADSMLYVNKRAFWRDFSLENPLEFKKINTRRKIDK